MGLKKVFICSPLKPVADNEDNALKMIDPILLYQLFFVGQDKKNSSTILMMPITKERIEVQDMEFTVGTFRGLRRMNVHYLDELLECNLSKLRNTVGIGAHRSEEIRRRVSELGYEMKS